VHVESIYIHLNTNTCTLTLKNLIDEQINMQMEKQYQKLNKKLDNLSNKSNTQQSKHQKRTKETNREQQQRIVNLTNIKLTQEQQETLSLGPKYAIEKEHKHYINDLIIDTENAIRKLEPVMQNTCRHLAKKQIKIISNSNRKNILHKRYQYCLNIIKHTLKNNNATMIKADKSKAIVLIQIEDLNKKFKQFILDNDIQQVSKDPTGKYQKMIQQAIKKNTLIIE